MNSPFIFNKPLSAIDALGRNSEVNWLATNLIKGHNSLVWGHPKTGKTTFINQALALVRKNENQTVTCAISCYNSISFQSLLANIANSLFKTFAGITYSDWTQLIDNTLPVTHPEVTVLYQPEQEQQLLFKNLTADNPSIDASIKELLMLPQRMANAKDKKVILVFESFHNILKIATASQLTSLAKAWQSQVNVTFVLCGNGTCAPSQTSAFNHLFTSKKPFYKFAEQIELGQVDEKDFTDYMVRNFSKAGRVISKDFAERIYRSMEGHPFYTQQFADICFSNTQGYMSEPMYVNGLKEMLDQHQSEFELVCESLSTPQIQFLHALTDQVEQFSANEVLNLYGLNSSANVFRVRDALERKEIIETIRKKPCFIDPLFKMWFKERFCHTFWI